MGHLVSCAMSRLNCNSFVTSGLLVTCLSRHRLSWRLIRVSPIDASCGCMSVHSSGERPGSLIDYTTRVNSPANCQACCNDDDASNQDTSGICCPLGPMLAKSELESLFQWSPFSRKPTWKEAVAPSGSSHLPDENKLRFGEGNVGCSHVYLL